MRLLMAILASSLLAPNQPAQKPADHPAQVTKAESPFDNQKLKTIVGCIAERNGKYLLVNKKHPLGIEMRMFEHLGDHVGLQARVTGVLEYISTTRVSGQSSDAGSGDVVDVNNGPSEKEWARHSGWLQVSSMTFMSGNCKTR